jgi:hypothetical protein
MTLSVALLDEPLPSRLSGQIDALLAARDPAVLGYHARAYQGLLGPILGDRLRHLVASDETGALVGYMPFRERSGPAGRVLCALPFFGPNALIHAAADAPPDTKMRLVETFRHAGAGALSITLYTPLMAPVEPLAAALGADDRIDKFTQFLDLGAFDRWPAKRRADIARACAAGLAVRVAGPSDLPEVIELHRAVARNTGAPAKPAEYLEAAFDLARRSPGVARWTVAQRATGGALAGCLLTLMGPLTMSYVLPAALATERSNQPVPLLIDEAVSFARANRLRYFNMESSPRFGDPVFKFKERWGAQMGRYAVLIAYPCGRARAEAIPEADLGRAYPYYFVRPFGSVGGALPSSLGAPA